MATRQKVADIIASSFAALQISWWKAAITAVITMGVTAAVPAALEFIALVSVTSFIGGVVFWARWGHMVKFYETRPDASRISLEISKAKTVWASWYTAAVVGSTGEMTRDLGRRIERVILTKPNPLGFLGYLEGLYEGISVASIQSDIERAKERLELSGVQKVLLLDGPILGMVIFEPFNAKKGYIRLEPTGPHLEANDRPVIIVEAKRHPRAFHNLVQSFDLTWQALEKAASPSETDTDVP